MKKLETGLYASFWDNILEQANKSNLTLQNPRIDLNTAVAVLMSLKTFIQNKRDSFAEYEKKGAELSGCNAFKTKRQRKINVRLAPLGTRQAAETFLTPSETFRIRSFLPVIDQFVSSLEQRLEAYQLVNTRFGFLGKLATIENEEIMTAAQNLIENYNDDLDNNLGNELIQFKSFCDEFTEEGEIETKVISQERWMYKLLIEKDVKDCFPNVEVALRMFLSIMVTNSTGERSFSKLKLVKNRLRTTMSEDRLNFLCIMSLECDILRQISYEDIINKFVNIKCRRVAMNQINSQ